MGRPPARPLHPRHGLEGAAPCWTLNNRVNMLWNNQLWCDKRTDQERYVWYVLFVQYLCKKMKRKTKNWRIEELLLNFVIVSLFWFSRLPSTTPHLPLSPVLAVPVRSTKIKKKSHTHLWEYCQQRACTLDGPPRLSPLKEDQAVPNTEIKPERQDVYC